MKKKRRTKSNSKKRSKLFLGLIIVLAVLLVFFLFVQWDLDFKLVKEVQSFDIVDTCGVSPLGNEILHEIPDDASCKIRCDNLCGVRDLEYFEHDFITENLTCYRCNCSCK